MNIRSTALCAFCHRIFSDVCVFCGLNITKENRSAVRGICGRCYQKLYDPSLPLSNAETVELAKRHYSRVKGYEAMHAQDQITISRLRKENWKLKRKIAKFEKKE